ncbi:protein translocase subunit SecF [Parathalassolituus penaei]|uniref:Protein-export membrane protein SecF n=1 Tax=Parathalassolituus penaei TaxID=2997323 RepID=A0A9X3IRZ1_9GAMM|nr:protein translocase subunit SecF [Parathalassolituus penaei]MCY0963608.1 protein translocase subunit SecF [Parathalassolituus penaei]
MSKKHDFDYMKYSKLALLVSLLAVVVSIGALAVKGLNMGLDFTGGTLLEVKYTTAVPVQDISTALGEAGYKGVSVQSFGAETDVLVRMSESFHDGLGEEVLATLQKAAGANQLILKRSEFVGANVGEDLRDQGGMALLLALFLIMLYVAARFQFKFSVGAVLALFHDVIIILGVFAIFQINFDLTVMAALLAVIGYSLNDTIVVADHIRDNFRTMLNGTPREVINDALNHTFGRTLMTSLTTALVLVALLVVGGQLIRGFATALLIGVVVGTYSSIYVASALLLAMKVSREDLMPPEVQDEIDDRP